MTARSEQNKEEKGGGYRSAGRREGGREGERPGGRTIGEFNENRLSRTNSAAWGVSGEQERSEG